MVISLTPDIEAALTDEARERGTTPESLALDSLRERFISTPPSESPAAGEETLADFLRGHIGVLHSSEQVPGGARMSENCGEKFAAGVDRLLTSIPSRQTQQEVLHPDVHPVLRRRGAGPTRPHR